MTSKYPEKGELILGSVKNIFNQGAFIELDEYSSRTGMLHITEISLKWVRNIRDYVKEKQKVVLLVLRTDEDKGHVDLSLRRVTDSQRKWKLQQVKQKQRAMKLLEMVAQESGIDETEVITDVTEALSEYETLYEGLEAISADNSVVDGLNMSKKLSEKLVDLINKNIKPPEVEVVGYIELKSKKPDGIEAIRNALDEVIKHKSRKTEMDLSYVSAPMYRVKIKADNYKLAEKCLKNSVKAGIEYIESKSGRGEFHRELDGK